MSNEHNNPQLNSDGNWLDEVLGTDIPKAELSPEDLATIGEKMSDQQMNVDRLLEDEIDQQTITEIQEHVAEELPLVLQEEQATSRIPFADPVFSVSPNAIDEPTMAIPSLDQTASADVSADGTRRFTSEDLESIGAAAMNEAYFAAQDSAYNPAEEAAYIAGEEASYISGEEAAYIAGEEVENPVGDTQQEKSKKSNIDKTGYGLFGIPHILSTVIWLALIVVIGVSLGRMLWVCCADLMAFGKPDQQISVTITAQDVKVLPDGTKEVDMDSISGKLGDVGLIEYPALFKFFAEITGKDQSLSPGDYTLNSYFDYNAMINAMSSYEKPREVVTVLIPEGYNCAQLFALLEAYEVCTVEELEACAANGDEELNEYWFLTDEIPWGEKYCLEGYLFPDTYEFYTNDDPAHVLNKMLSNFDARFTDKMKENLKNIEERYGLTLREVLIIASMVEEEAVGATKTTTEYEGYNIASVFYNRLANWDTPILGCDATVYYAMGDFFGATEELTAEHLDTDSPYNTRKYAGLPPGPITNPGSYSMYAALTPNDTDYYYYVYDPEQKCHILSKTEAEHNKLAEELGY